MNGGICLPEAVAFQNQLHPTPTAAILQAVKGGGGMGRHRAEQKLRSGCPVSLGLDIFGDKWTLLIVRDLMFNGKRHYREFLQSAEGISSNILADRLKLLLSEGIVTTADDPSHLQKVVYSLTEKGLALLPVLMQISAWSFEYRPVGQEYRNQPPLNLEQQMNELRRAHVPEETANS